MTFCAASARRGSQLIRARFFDPTFCISRSQEHQNAPESAFPNSTHTPKMRALTPAEVLFDGEAPPTVLPACEDRKSTRLNSSHVEISYAVFCLKKKKKNTTRIQ